MSSGVSQSPLPKQKLSLSHTYQKTKDFTYTVDVLTDGSEQSGPATLFLSVYKPGIPYEKGGNGIIDLNDEVAAPALRNRYAISALGDLLARAASDQRYKLHPVRAVFTQQPGLVSLQGLPSLLLVLHNAGKPELTVVSSENTAQRIDSVVQTLHRYKQHPLVQIGRVPTPPPTASSQSGVGNHQNEDPATVSWWIVYKDDFLLVHAASSADDGSIVYLHTLRKLPCGKKSLFIVPAASTAATVKYWLSHLPLGDHEPLGILAGVCDCHSLANEISSIQWYIVSPRPSGDPGLLVRAQQQSRIFHQVLPLYFPWNNTCEEVVKEVTTGRLYTGDSLSVVVPADHGGHPKLSVVNRFVQQGIDTDKASSIERRKWPLKLKSFLTAPESVRVNDDENEIDLDCLEDCEEDDSEPDDSESQSKLNSNVADLLVLGTGCAAPSPHRGASGYVLFLKGDCSSIVFEVGEGFVTQWNRYAGGRPLDSISLIWISHAHWDHYGGLVNLLVCLHHQRAERKRHLDSAEQPSKRQRSVFSDVPCVIAPRKVLRYLNLTFVSPREFFRGADHSHKQATFPMYQSVVASQDGRRPIVFWEDVLVDHSCHQSYGFVMGLEAGEGNVCVICFSGDTRPCRTLVDACRTLAARYGQKHIDLLIHEATFDESEKEMSIAKKHSTIAEALSIASEGKAKRSLLTHFSQRYDSAPQEDSIDGVTIGFAIDGMQVPL